MEAGVVGRTVGRTDHSAHARALQHLIEFSATEKPSELLLRRLDWDLSRVSLLETSAMRTTQRLSNRDSAELTTLRGEVAAALERFLDEGVWAGIRIPELWPLVLRDGKGRITLEFGGATEWRTVFWFTFGQLLLHAGGQLRLCPACNTMFVRTGKREYCTTTCSANQRAKRHYDAHRDEILELRHAAYVRKRKRGQRNVKVARRPRLQQIATDSSASVPRRSRARSTDTKKPAKSR
jgi:hypothetical protein